MIRDSELRELQDRADQADASSTATLWTLVGFIPVLMLVSVLASESTRPVWITGAGCIATLTAYGAYRVLLRHKRAKRPREAHTRTSGASGVVHVNEDSND